MKKILPVLLILLCILTNLIYAETKRISLLDFVVHSDNAGYKYMGKGISEMIAIELRKSPGIILIEREKRGEILLEMEASLSDMANAATQIQIGRMLTADYLIAGEIIDLMSEVLISLRMIKIETGEVVWNEKLNEKISKYHYITGYFTASILKYLNLKAAQSTEEKTVQKLEKDEKAVIALSKAIDLYDKKENEAAKKEIALAKTIDPKNETVNIYAQKLAGLSPKFRVELEKHTPANNPAALGMIDKDECFFWASMPLTGMEENQQNNYGNGMYGHEVTQSFRLGYMFPIGSTFGFAVEAIFAHQDNSINNLPAGITHYDGSSGNRWGSYPSNIGGSLSLGYRLVDFLSIGASFHLFNTGNWSNIESAGEYIPGTYLAVGGGFLLQFFQEQLILDVQAVYTNQQEQFVLLADNKIVGGNMPFILEGTLTGALLNKTLFLALKTIGEVYTENRAGLFLRAIPMVEYWPLSFLSIRAGYEYAQLTQIGEFKNGHGVTGGATLKLGDFGLNVNCSYRYKPLHILPGYQFDQLSILFGVTYSPRFLTR